MNEIYKLIEKLCPEGVSYKCFGDVCDYIRGITYNKAQEAKEYDKNTWKVLRANNITLATKTLNFDDIKEVVSTVKVKDSQHLQKGDILICAGSGSKEHIGKVAYIPENLEYIFGGFMAVIRCHKELNSRFLFHILTGSLFSKYLETALNTTTINNLNATIISGFRIPLPPLAVQQEIVRILDSFTELTTELNKKLTAELTARRKQYEHYRDELLSVGGDFKTYPLGEVTEFIRNGYNYKADGDRSKTYKISRIETISTGVINMERVGSSEQINERYLLQDGDILFSHINSLPYLGNVAYYTENLGKLYHGMNLLCFRAKKELVIPKYLYYVLKSNNIRKLVNRYAKQSCNQYSLTTSDIKSWTIPLPSLEQQEDIVSVLDRFDAICNDLTSGLPAEIAARQKQYEYYRDKLLTFKELEI